MRSYLSIPWFEKRTWAKEFEKEDRSNGKDNTNFAKVLFRRIKGSCTDLERRK
jgi:hypothetical protein